MGSLTCQGGAREEDSGSKSETESGGEGVHRDGSRAWVREPKMLTVREGVTGSEVEKLEETLLVRG